MCHYVIFKSRICNSIRKLMSIRNYSLASHMEETCFYIGQNPYFVEGILWKINFRIIELLEHQILKSISSIVPDFTKPTSFIFEKLLTSWRPCFWYKTKDTLCLRRVYIKILNCKHRHLHCILLYNYIKVHNIVFNFPNHTHFRKILLMFDTNWRRGESNKTKCLGLLRRKPRILNKPLTTSRQQ